MIKIAKKRVFVFFLGITIFFSCSNEKKFLYYQKADNEPDTLKIADSYIPRIQSGDILSIFVSSLSPEASSFFNPFAGASVGGLNASASAGSSASLPGYLVDAQGEIELPLIGATAVKGLTTIEAKNAIKEKLKIYLKEPTVNVRFLNYKISISGEVVRPSVYVIPNEMITLPEALTMAGDLTVFGNRKDILVIRDHNGKKEFGHVDLSTREIYTSPYYYLHNNDLIYVKPTKIKAAQLDRTISYVTVGISIISLLYIIIKR